MAAFSDQSASNSSSCTQYHCTGVYISNIYHVGESYCSPSPFSQKNQFSAHKEGHFWGFTFFSFVFFFFPSLPPPFLHIFSLNPFIFPAGHFNPPPPHSILQTMCLCMYTKLNFSFNIYESYNKEINYFEINSDPQVTLDSEYSRYIYVVS